MQHIAIDGVAWSVHLCVWETNLNHTTLEGPCWNQWWWKYTSGWGFDLGTICTCGSAVSVSWWFRSNLE